MVVSDHVPGVRLSTILAAAETHLLPVEMNAALCLLRQLVHAVAVLHDKAPDVCHGAIGPERIIVTPHARLVLVEYVLGSAIEQLRYSNKQYWQDLRVPLPRTFGMPHLDRRTDVTQVGATALALVIGRPLADDEFPAQISDMTASASGAVVGRRTRAAAAAVPGVVAACAADRFEDAIQLRTRSVGRARSRAPLQRSDRRD